MKVFISYRREDTAGRAGRLFDVLVNRFGVRNVFQDVAAIAPGMDFARQVDEAIAQSDAVLVVIGSEWLTLRGPDGTRRLDAPDDFVRREVAAALAAGGRVVPVLVEGSELPPPGELPDVLRDLTTRQAVVIRDATWHQDVDALVRRLEGDDLIDVRRRRWPIVTGVAAALVAALVVGLTWLGDGGDGDDDGDDDGGGLTACPEPDATFSPIDVRDGATAVQRMDPQVFAYTVSDAAYRVEGDETLILLRAELANQTPPVAGTHDDDTGFSHTMFDRLFVDGLSVGTPHCFVVIVGDEAQIEPGQRAVALVGYLARVDVEGAALVVETDGDQEIAITG